MAGTFFRSARYRRIRRILQRRRSNYTREALASKLDHRQEGFEYVVKAPFVYRPLVRVTTGISSIESRYCRGTNDIWVYEVKQ